MVIMGMLAIVILVPISTIILLYLRKILRLSAIWSESLVVSEVSLEVKSPVSVLSKNQSLDAIVI